MSTGRYSVEALTPELEAAYTRFWEGAAAGSGSVLAYHHLAWRDVLAAVLGPDAGPRYRVVVEGAGAERRVVAALPLFVRHAAPGAVHCSLPFFGPNAGVVCDEEHPDARRWHALLIDAAVDDARREEALALTLYTPFLGGHPEWYREALGPDAVCVERLTQHMELAEPPEWSGKIAYDVRVARRAGLEVVDRPAPAQVEEFWALYRANCAAYAIPRKPRASLDACLREMLPRGLGNLAVAVDPAAGGRVVAGLLTLRSPRTVSYFIPAYDAAYRSAQPMALVIDHAARAAAARGARLWNWEASPSRESGVYRYKARWGSRESRYRVYSLALGGEERLAALGGDALASEYPFFFVYPFDRLDEPVEQGAGGGWEPRP